MKFVLVVYLRFYKALQRVCPLGPGGTELLTRGEMWALRIFKLVGGGHATQMEARETKEAWGMYFALGILGRKNKPRKDIIGTPDEM